MLRMFLCLLVAVCFTSAAYAQSDDLPSLTTKVKTLAVFKNGLGFVYRAGETPLKDGWADMGEIPAAALGTYWVGTSDAKSPIEQLLSYKKTVSKDVEALDLGELLAANIGKWVDVCYSDYKEPRHIVGTVVSVPKIPPATQPDRGYGGYSSTPSGARQGYGQMIIIKEDGSGGYTAINRSQILSVQTKDGASLSFKSDAEQSAAKFKVKGNPAKTEVSVAYLQKGFTWSPSYLIDLLSEKQAQLTLDAVLANDVEDIEDAEVSFVVGYPNFMFADQMTPLSLNQTVSQFIGSLMGGDRRDGYGNRMSGMMAQSASNMAYDYNARNNWDPSSAYSAVGALPGESNEDLFLYKQKNVTMKKGSRARFAVFTGKVDIEHVYLWDMPDSMNVDQYGNRMESRSDRNQPPVENQVWHCLRIDNKTGQPLTTASAFVVNGSMPVAQDMLKYTPVGAKNDVKLTVATDVSAGQVINEESRKQLQTNGRNYDEVTVTGKLTLKNWKSKSVKLSVKKNLVGEVLESGAGKATKVVRQLAAANPNSQIEWEFDLGPQETKELGFTYTVLFYR